MDLPEIEYELHDSYIETISYSDQEILEIDIVLYNLYYPDNEKVRLVFEGIYNGNRAKQFCEELTSKASDDRDGLGCRIDCFDYDKKRKSIPGNLYYFFEVDWIGWIRIHCKNMYFAKLK